MIFTVIREKINLKTSIKNVANAFHKVFVVEIRNTLKTTWREKTNGSNYIGAVNQ
jgi:hypothetical protein